MELVWEDPPVPDAPFLTRDHYEKYSLAPTVRELWTFLQGPAENANIKKGCDVETAKASYSPSTQDTAEFKDKSCISKEEPCYDSCDSKEPHADNAEDAEEECRGTIKSQVKPKQAENEAQVPYPDPRIPFPCLSNVSRIDQSIYLSLLINNNISKAPEKLKERVRFEVMEFMRYLQDVARMCADDYNCISQGAMQYSEDFFRSCLECIKTFPQFYQIHEMTSLTGGTFNPGLNLTFEKQLLIMGDVDITDHQIVPADAQLASDYQSVSSENPPAKKAKDMHARISSDDNAEKLCMRYEPDVCLTHDALVRLLDNHGPDFGDPWELPVCVKVTPEKGSGQKKTVYVDSPLLKTQMTVRERSHFYHEESLKLSIKKDRSKKVFHLMTDIPASENQLHVEDSQRNPVCFENDGLELDMGFTDLETFGETTTVKTPKVRKTSKEEDACAKSKDATHPPTLSKSEPSVPRTELVQPEIDQDLSGDSEDEKLVIDVSVSPVETPTKQPDSTLSSASPTDPVNSESSPPQKAPRRTRQSRRAKTGDQLGEILRMQKAMFSSANDRGKCSTASQETNSPTRTPGPSVSVHPHPTSLVKPCVSSYLERNQDQDEESCTAPQISAPVINSTSTEHKKILSQDLQASAEDEQDYKAPEKGNLLYKLYSLQDLLVMVRSSVSLTHSRKVGSGPNQYVPVHVLPKLEYQLCYGVESLTSTEACKLWTETLLHSSTVSYIAHINAFTSKVALVRKLPDDWKQNISCGFKPSKSLNILHHLLKKLTGLDKGQYLIAHKAGEPFVTLLKVATGRVNRGAYDLQQHHGSVPQPPASGLVPWIPVDPAVVLPFHRAHGRVPCTFPIFPFQMARARPSNNMNTGGKKKKKRPKRAAKRKKF